MIPFTYTKVSEQLINESVAAIESLESTVFIGPRFIGKQYLLERLIESAQDTCASPIVNVNLLSQPGIEWEDALAEKIAESVRRTTNEDLPPMVNAAENLFASIDHLHATVRKPVVLVASNVDSMPVHLARRFLRHIRSRVEEKTLVVALTGEFGFRDLVYGPNSEFTSARQYFIEGFDLETFSKVLDRYVKLPIAAFEHPADAAAYLFEQTGGNIHFLRFVIWQLVERRLQVGYVPASAPLVTMEDLIQTIDTRRVLGGDVIWYIDSVIVPEPVCWNALVQLIRDDESRLSFGDFLPGPLEVAGIARRCTDHTHLTWACPMIRTAVCQHYDDRRLGDLYAGDGNWGRAFFHYQDIPKKRRIRPSGVEDLASVEAVINVLGAHLYSEGTSGVLAIENLFVNGCRHVLGFEHVTFWKHRRFWEPRLASQSEDEQELFTAIERLLPPIEPPTNGTPGLHPPVRKYGVIPTGDGPKVQDQSRARIVLVEDTPQNQTVGIVICDSKMATPISPVRSRLLGKLLDYFQVAHTHAIHVERLKARLDERHAHELIVSLIFEKLGSQILDVNEVLREAASGLRKLEYKRVFFCLVDPTEQVIRGVYCDPPNPDIIDQTKYSLDDPEVDLQPWVVANRKPIIVWDATLLKLANRDLARRLEMQSEAIIPLISAESGQAIGTVHVEHDSGNIPSTEMAADLQEFGARLAVAIEQSERVNMLQTALDKSPEPILILDVLRRLRYANKPAKKLFGVHNGWRNRSETLGSAPLRIPEIDEFTDNVIANQSRDARHVSRLGKSENYRAEVILECISNWLNEPIGLLVHIEDLNHIFTVLIDVFPKIASANNSSDAIHALLDATKALGHKWGRLYTIEPNQPDTLVSRHCFGMRKKHKTLFDQRSIHIQRIQEDMESFRCLAEGDPVVFCCLREHPDKNWWTTSTGLSAFNIHSPKCQSFLAKSPGEYWIDFPLKTHDRLMGKLTLQCDDQLRPERFALLKVLCRMTSTLLDAFLRRETQVELEHRLTHEAAAKATAIAAHHIKARVAGLPGLVSRYKLREAQWPGSHELNIELGDVCRVIDADIRHIQESLTINKLPQRSQFDLKIEIEVLLEKLFPSHDVWRIVSSEEHFRILADKEQISKALMEIFKNSRDFMLDQDSRLLSVTLDRLGAKSGDHVVITISDSGPGVSPENKRRIFEEYFTHRPGKESGTGLGLSFAYKTIEAHIGTIEEIGDYGKGAKFVIILPQF